MDLTLLGTAGWIPGARRETACFAVRAADLLLVFDAGTGLRRLLDPQGSSLFDGVGEVHLLLSHYHLDHVCGLAYFSGVLPDRDVVVHAPAEELTGVDPHQALTRLIGRPYFPERWDDLDRVSLEPVPVTGLELAGHTIRARAQQHSDVSVAYRLDDALVVATDTIVDPGTAEFAAGVDLLLHEAWYCLEAEPRGAAATLPRSYAAHSEATAVARLAADAGVGRLVLIHLNPLRSEAYYAAMREVAAAVFPETTVAPDGAVLTIGDDLPDAGADSAAGVV